jgi:hypothetical protein
VRLKAREKACLRREVSACACVGRAHLAHEEADDDHELLDGAAEGRHGGVVRRLAEGRLELFVRVAVLELQCRNAAL